MDDLPEGYDKIEGFHGFGRDIYLAREILFHDVYQIFSKDAWSKEWLPGKRYIGADLAEEEFKSLKAELEANFIATQDLKITKKIEGFGRF